MAVTYSFDSCVTSYSTPAYAALPLCPVGYQSTVYIKFQTPASVNIVCYNSSFGTPSTAVTVPAFTACGVSGALTEKEQIEAIDSLFPYVVAIISAAWAFRFIIGLVNTWLKETRTDHD